MAAVYCEAGIFLSTMALGYALKRLGILKPEDKQVLSNLVFYVTLPAMLIGSFGSVSVDFWFVASFLLGLGVNAVMVGAGALASRKKTPDLQALYIINCAGLNLGNIVIPFLQGFFPDGIPYLCMFDTGDSFFTLGTTYAIARGRLGQRGGSFFSALRGILSSLLRSIPFDVYILMTMLSLLHIRLPEPVLLAADFMGRGNGFLAMLLVGVSMDLRLDVSSLGEVIRILAVRYICAAAAALFVWFALPAPLVMRQSLTAAVFAATPSAALIYSNRLGIRTEIAGALSPISTVLMIPMMSAVMTLTV